MIYSTEALSVKDTADRIEETVKGISDMLTKNGDDDTDTVSRDKVLLQRYLSNASIRLCSTSRSASPNPQGGLDGIVEESGQDGLVQKAKQRPEGGKRRKQYYPLESLAGTQGNLKIPGASVRFPTVARQSHSLPHLFRLLILEGLNNLSWWLPTGDVSHSPSYPCVHE